MKHPGGAITTARVFVRRTSFTPDDDLAFIGEPPLYRPDVDSVHVSCVFTWDKAEALRLRDSWARYYDNVQVGGPAFDDPGNEFVPGMYLKRGITITSRGCPKKCPWCFVPKREGALREYAFIPVGHIIQDNNLLACSRGHIEGVFEMLRWQNKAAKFSGGLDIDFLRPWHVDLLQTIKVKELWVACDTEAALKRLRRVAGLLSDFPIEKKRCYVLIGHNTSLDECEDRCGKVLAMGFLPFAQLYRSPDREINWTKEWKALQRKWSRPAIYRSATC